jgi:uncharacterized protein YegL
LECGNLTERKDENRRKPKLWRIILTVLVALLTFAGPTYVVYALINVLNIDYALSMVSGIVLFTAGLALAWYLIENKIIT